MTKNRAGSFVVQQAGSDGFKAFIPKPLPPDPPLDYGAFRDEQERAAIVLGKLEGAAHWLSRPELFIYSYIRKEAVLSSQIEGTQSTLSDLLLAENMRAPGIPESDDIREVSNYVAAMEQGLERLGDLPLSLRLIKEVHRTLMRNARGGAKAPGEFRTSQNWVGGTKPGDARYVPPPPHEVMRALGDLEKFLHNEPERTTPLIKAGLAHAQFETIHPFLDGNGRIGRLLITLILCAEGVMSRPFLYLSLYFKRNRDQYYEKLQRVRTEGDWEGWLKFYLVGVIEVASNATETARKIVETFSADEQAIDRLRNGRNAASRVHSHMKARVFTSIAAAAEALDVTQPTATKGLKSLVDLGVCREVTGRPRSRVFVYSKYLDILNEDTTTQADLAREADY